MNLPNANTDTAELQQRLMSMWAGFLQSGVDEAVDQWRKMLDACDRAQGDHFEQLFCHSL